MSEPFETGETALKLRALEDEVARLREQERLDVEAIDKALQYFTRARGGDPRSWSPFETNAHMLLRARLAARKP